MGLNSWWRDSADKADNFLDTGAYNDVVRNAPLNNDATSGSSNDFNQLNGCTSSAQCPAGYACVNGQCTLMGTGSTGGSSNGQWNSAGGCNQDDPNSPCNSGGPNSCSQTPNCGNIPDPRPQDCCGTRCCSYGSASSSRPGVHCWCGECPPWPEWRKCSIFCDSYTAANGESVMGCNEDNSCNECNECDLFSKSCEPKDDAPCWCEGSECQGCFKCDTEPTSDNFGGCSVAFLGACSVCTHVDSYKCPCGEIVGPITACSKYGPGGSGYGGNVTLTSKTALQLAQEKCAPASSCDPCRGDCTSRSYCSDTTGPPPPCPPGIKCTNTGTLSAGGVDCTFRTECDMSNVPESCKNCDCNCHNDCPNCQICGEDGECHPDPDCEDITARAILRPYFSGEEVVPNGCYGTSPCGCTEGATPVSCSGVDQYSAFGKLPFRWVTIVEPVGVSLVLKHLNCCGGIKQWRHNPDAVLGSWELRDAEDNRVFGPVGRASCACLNCCENSTIHFADTVPSHKIVDYEYRD